MSMILKNSANRTDTAVVIFNPYEAVDWQTTGHYNAALHTHSNQSDGMGTVAEMAERYYELGFDIMSFNDHDVTTDKWSNSMTGRQTGHPGSTTNEPIYGRDREQMTEEREAEIMVGADRSGRLMYPVRFSSEPSVEDDHYNVYFARIPGPFDSAERFLAEVRDAGGIARLNHPGRTDPVGHNGGGRNAYNLLPGRGTGVTSKSAPELAAGAAASNNVAKISRYAALFENEAYRDILIGIEVMNSRDGETLSDRIIWDNILARMMPRGRMVWGFADDDSHHMIAAGFAYNVMLIDPREFAANGNAGWTEASAAGLTAASRDNPIRKAMETGAFYAVSRVDRREGINDDVNSGKGWPQSTIWSSPNIEATDMLNRLPEILRQPVPKVTGVIIDEDSGAITVKGENYDYIDWIVGSGSYSSQRRGKSIDGSRKRGG